MQEIDLSKKLRFIAKLCLAFPLFASFMNVSFASDLQVSAASSLSNAFKAIAQRYQQINPATKIQFNFGASGALLQQLAKGAPIDVFATADQETMDAATKQELILQGERKNFIRNALVVVQAKTSTIPLNSLEGLTQTSVKRIAIGNPASVPAGRYAMHALTQAKLEATLAPKFINTLNVRQALDYVAREEVEAGFVYASDAAIMSDKVKVSFMVPLSEDLLYPVAISKELQKDANKLKEAKSFVQFLLSAEAQAILLKYGFKKI